VEESGRQLTETLARRKAVNLLAARSARRIFDCVEVLRGLVPRIHVFTAAKA
jgi:hypothetical protein